MNTHVVVKDNRAGVSGGSGFTLIELLLVISLLAISVGVTSDIMISLIRGYNKSQVINEVEQQSNFVALKLEKELRNAITVSSPNSEETSSNTLTFTNRDEDLISYILDSDTGVLSRKINDEPTAPITSNESVGGVRVLCPSSCFTLVGTSPTIIKFSLGFEQAHVSALINFTGDINIDNTVVLRSTY